MTNPSTSLDPFAEQVILDLREAIMAEIEPDLTDAGMPTLSEKYKDETPEQRAARVERYMKAEALCQERMNAAVEDWKTELTSFADRTLLKADTVPPPPLPQDA